jgi:hypothetical protein
MSVMTCLGQQALIPGTADIPATWHTGCLSTATILLSAVAAAIVASRGAAFDFDHRWVAHWYVLDGRRTVRQCLPPGFAIRLAIAVHDRRGPGLTAAPAQPTRWPCWSPRVAGQCVWTGTPHAVHAARVTMLNFL